MLRSLQFALRGSGETGTISGGFEWGDFVTMTAGYRRQIGRGPVKMNYVPGHVCVCVYVCSDWRRRMRLLHFVE